MWELICISLAIILFIIYNIIAIKQFGIPYSLSNTYYLYNKKKKDLGYVFTGLMFLISVLLLPAWISLTLNIVDYGECLTVIPFLAVSAMSMIGAAPAFRSCTMENNVHTISAGVAATFALLWDFVVCWNICYIVPLTILVFGGIAHLTKTHKSGMVYWLEMSAFVSTFLIAFIESLILM